MLVLTRKQGEVIQIGDSITITVVRMKGKSVRLGIKAPKDFNVIRGELAFENLKESNDEKSEVPVTGITSNNSKRIIKDAGHYRDGSAWSTNSARTAESAPTSTTEAWSV
jgi:carbon storage regulator CsrA